MTSVTLADELATPEAKRSAFGLAASVALSDRRLAAKEKDSLAILAAALGIPEAEAQQLVSELKGLV